MEVVLYRTEWNPERGGLSAYSVVSRHRSIEELPQWMQERYAVLRLLNEHEASPLGMWRLTTTYSLDAIHRAAFGGLQREQRTPCLLLYIVRQPYDPEWED